MWPRDPLFNRGVHRRERPACDPCRPTIRAWHPARTNRTTADRVAAGLPMLEPSDRKEAYDFTLLAIRALRRWRIPVLLRMTTRVCTRRRCADQGSARAAQQPTSCAMCRAGDDPGYARPAHHRLRAKLAEIAAWNESDGPIQVIDGDRALGIITSGFRTSMCARPAPRGARAQGRPHLSLAG